MPETTHYSSTIESRKKLLRIAHVTPSVTSRGTGVATVVLELAKAQEAGGHTVTVHAVQDGSASEALDRGTQVRLGKLIGPVVFSFSPDLVNAILNDRPDVVHSHGIWTYPSYAAHKASRMCGIPHICAPHGMLEPWALDRGAIKKSIMRRLFQNRVLSASQCMHALTWDEVESMRKFGLRNPVACVPTGVDESFLQLPHDRNPFLQRFKHLHDKRIVLFVGRLHPKKGLLNLVEAWRQLGQKTRDWQLVIAGPDEKGHGLELERAIRETGLDDSIHVIGDQTRDEVCELYQAAELFILTSFSEGFSRSVLEALASGIPVCITRQCHFPEVTEFLSGIECEPNPGSVATALDRIMCLTVEERTKMGQSGIDLIRARYTWPRVVAQLNEVYAWASHQTSSAPEFITRSSEKQWMLR